MVSGQDILYREIGYLIGFVLVGGIMLVRRRPWVRRAYRLAAQSGIALPAPLVGRVARYLRNEILFGQILSGLTAPLLSALVLAGLAHRNWAVSLPWAMVGVPLYWAAFCLALTTWPRWTASGGDRVIERTTRSVRQAFTPAEFSAVTAGVIFSVAFTAWGLWYASASPLWWLGCALALAVGVAVGHSAAERVLNRPTGAADWNATGWAYVLQFRQVRGLVGATAWAPAVCAYLIDCVASSAFVRETTEPGGVTTYQLQWWPIIVPVIVIVALAFVFRQGRQRWREAWLERGGGL